MHHGDFLDYGLRIQEAEDEWRLDNILKELSDFAPDDECPDCALLRAAARHKRDKRLVLVSLEERERLLPMAQKWCSMNSKTSRDKQRENYRDALCGDGHIQTLCERDRKTRDFHAMLCKYTEIENKAEDDYSDEELKTLGSSLLLVEEAAEQWAQGFDSKRREPKAWHCDHTVRTIWTRDTVLT